MDRLRTAHPGLGLDAPNPVDKARNETEVLHNVLLADQPNRQLAPSRDGDGGAEKALEHENAFGMVPQRTMPIVGGDGFRFSNH